MNGCSAARKGELLALAQRLGVTFHDIGLLHTALIHTSYANEAQGRVAHNERLEFLGDAVLELASSTYLYTHFPTLPEGELTKTRASIVCSAALAKIAARLGLGEYLLLGHGEEMSGGRARTTNLEDAFEAVLGAIYLDQGWETARDYALRQLAPEFDQVRHGENLQDYKTLLQELVQKTPGSTIAYELLEATGPDHAKHYRYAVVIDGKTCGEGEGSSKKEAEQQAARMALARQKK
ncbi:ribonuclease III [Selenomonas bovis]|uniref:Ribonuclease 3 n=1 Tax=Selenomonas bovis TaxID=416586 RepID=A0A848B3F0_9FIRM|nr:ribonuclease III [Selenomonas bovis]MCI6751951.1 ribonuclease III [Selenomonas bovis]NMD98779.1 ribonuclease III [Selenomonas bovis]